MIKDSAVYFDPNNIDSISNAIKIMYNNPEIRFFSANKSFEYSKNYNWINTSKSTFNYLKEINMKYKCVV